MRGGSTRGQYPTQEYLLTVFRYEPDTGLLWRIRPGKGIKLHIPAGCLQGDGYVVVRLDGKLYLAHNIIWIMLHGYLDPANEVDHKDLDKANNKEYNLRELRRGLNKLHKLSYSSVGVKGVRHNPGSKIKPFVAVASLDFKIVHLGSFSTVVEAKAAYTKYMRDRGVPDDIIGP